MVSGSTLINEFNQTCFDLKEAINENPVEEIDPKLKYLILADFLEKVNTSFADHNELYNIKSSEEALQRYIEHMYALFKGYEV